MNWPLFNVGYGDLPQDHLHGGPDQVPILLRINCTCCAVSCGTFYSESDYDHKKKLVSHDHDERNCTNIIGVPN